MPWRRRSLTRLRKVNLTDNTIELGANHGLKAGDAVVYSKGGGTGIQASIDGITKDLAEGTSYYVILSGTDKVKLASTAANAKAGTAIDLTSAGTGTQSLTLAKAAPVSAGGSLGIGASVALNIANTTAIAEIADTAKLTGTINSLTLSADSISSATTTTTAGGMAAGGSGVGIGGAISIAVLNTDTRAFIGSGDALILGGDLSATATHTGSTVTKADGAASGGSAAVGIALGLNVVNDSTLSTTERNDHGRRCGDLCGARIGFDGCGGEGECGRGRGREGHHGGATRRPLRAGRLPAAASTWVPTMV